jgi:alpha-mannosidase
MLCLVVAASVASTNRMLASQHFAGSEQLPPPPPQGYTFYVTPHSHVDLEWYWTYDKTQVILLKILGRALDILKRDPRYAFTQDQMMAIKPFWESLSGADREFLRRMIKEGRFELATGTYVQPEIAEPDYESLTRQYLLAKPWMESTFDTKIATSWNIDTYGHTIQMPQLSVGAGIRYFCFMRDVLPSLQASVKRPFYWQSPDGSRVLAYWFSGSYGVRASNVATQLRTFIAHNLPGNDKILLPWGEDLYLPQENSAELERLVREAAAKVGVPVRSVLVTTSRHYFEAVEKSALALPTYTYDLNPPLYIQDLRGLYGERPGAKLAERRAEDLLESSEKFNVIAALHGQPYPAEELRLAWYKVLFNQDHDILPGSHTDEVEDAMNSRYGGAIETGRHTLLDAQYQLSRRINTANSGDFPFLVFNSLSFARTEVVHYTPLFKETIKNFRILDSDGTPVPFRLIAASRWGNGPLSMAAVEFLAKEVPGTGYRLYRIEPIEGVAQPSTWHPAKDVVSNDFFSLKVDPETGSITSIVDRRSGKELLDTRYYTTEATSSF